MLRTFACDSSAAYFVVQNRSLEYGERRCGFDTKHQSTKASRKASLARRPCRNLDRCGWGVHPGHTGVTVLKIKETHRPEEGVLIRRERSEPWLRLHSWEPWEISTLIWIAKPRSLSRRDRVSLFGNLWMMLAARRPISSRILHLPRIETNIATLHSLLYRPCKTRTCRMLVHRERCQSLHTGVPR